MTPPVAIRHKPVVNQAMQFTPQTRDALEAWLAAEIPGGFEFSADGELLFLETSQGDLRSGGYGSWVIRRQTRHGAEFYPVAAEVIEDDYEFEAEVPARREPS